MRTTVIAVAVAAALAGASAGVASAAAPHAAGGVPVIREAFTTLRCSGTPKHRTTLQMEGCAEHQLLATDHTIDGLAKTVYGKLSGSGRASFVTASRDWLSFRNAYCKAAASPSAGGTIAPLVDLQCLVKQDSEHVTDLRTFLQDAFANAFATTVLTRR